MREGGEEISIDLQTDILGYFIRRVAFYEANWLKRWEKTRRKT